MIKKFNNPLSNQNGSIIYVAMITSVLLLIGLRVANDLSTNSTKMSRFSRVKTAMSAADVKLRSLAHSPLSYTNCSSMVDGKCDIILKAFEDLKNKVPGAVCDKEPKPGYCGIDIQNVKLLPPDRFMADIVYTGQEISVKAINIDLTIPPEILQQSQYTCPAESPIFLGFNADLTIQCKALRNCQPGFFVSGVNPNTLDPICQKIPLNVNCGADEILASFYWDDKKATFEKTCVARINPYLFYKFEPKVEFQN